MPGSSTTPGRLGARVHAPIRVAFRIRNGVGTRDNNLCEAQWLACAFPYRRFAAVLTDDRARLGADVVSYSFTVSDLHRLLVAGLPAHCERLWTLPWMDLVVGRELDCAPVTVQISVESRLKTFRTVRSGQGEQVHFVRNRFYLAT